MRCVVLLLDALDASVQGFRERHDPLAFKIVPHITVVFPFKLATTDHVVVNHVRSVLSQWPPLSASLGEVKAVAGGYVYYKLERGLAETRRITEHLHTGPLREVHLHPDHEPHVTIGRVAREKQKAVMEEAKMLNPRRDFRISECLVERIGEDDCSLPIANVPLGGTRSAGRA